MRILKRYGGAIGASTRWLIRQDACTGKYRWVWLYQNLLLYPSFDWNHVPCVVLSAGVPNGHALKTKNVPIVILNRTFTTAQNLAMSLVHKFFSGRVDILAECTLLVNTAALGMTGKVPLICLDELPPHAVVYDIVYNPLMTGLLQAAQQRGNTVVTWNRHALHQARPATPLVRIARCNTRA